MNDTAVRGPGAGGVTMTALFVSHRAAPFVSVSIRFHTIGFHCQSLAANRDAVVVDGEGILIDDLSIMPGIQVDKSLDSPAQAVTVNGIRIMGGIQKKLRDMEVREPGLHGEEGMQEGEHVMPGASFQNGKDRKVIG